MYSFMNFFANEIASCCTSSDDWREKAALAPERYIQNGLKLTPLHNETVPLHRLVMVSRQSFGPKFCVVWPRKMPAAG